MIEVAHDRFGENLSRILRPLFDGVVILRSAG
jgi:hypothetical protein